MIQTSSIPRFAVLLSALVWGAAAGPLVAQPDQRPKITAARVGFDGHYRVGQWTPVVVTVEGGSQSYVGHLELVVPDGDGIPSRVISPRPYQVTPGQATSAMLYAKFGRIESDLEVTFRNAESGRVLAERKFSPSWDESEEGSIPSAMFSGQELIVSLGGSLGLPDAIRLHRRDEREAIVHVVLTDVEKLPTRWYGYESIDSLVMGTSRPEMYRKLVSSSDQLAALEQWVRRGGRLVLCVGSQAGEVLAEGQPLARFLPGRFAGMATLTQARDLEIYSETQEPLVASRGVQLRLPVPRLENVTGRIEAPDAATAELPLVVRAAYGFGEVVFVAVDLDQQPFVEWRGRGQFVNKLLARPAAGGDDKEDSATSGRVTSLGLTDLAGQLRGTLDQFEGVRLVPFALVAALVVLYILAIGPGDYFLVKRVLKRMELTWITFPLIVLLVSVGAYQLAYWLKGDELRLNQVDLVDVDLDSGLVRGTTWLNVFSPTTDAYNLTLRPRLADGEPAEDPEVLLSWLGLPGSALGGMDPTANNPPLFTRPYTFSPELDELRRLPIQVWSTKSLTARWTATDPQGLDAELSMLADGTLQGHVRNTTGVQLDDCWLAHDRWVYPLGALEPGQSVDLASLWKNREVLLSNLTGNRLHYDQEKKSHIAVATRYDQSSHQLPDILRQMMFYRAAGGKSYSGLHNRHQHFVDLSGHLTLGRAIVIGFTDRPGADLVRNSDGENWQPVQGPQDRRWTCYRFVVPVAGDSSERAN